MIAYAFCGSFCTIRRSLAVMRRLCESGEEIQPIMSEIVYHTDTRFGRADALCEEVTAICGREIIHSVRDAEPLGPVIRPELLIVAPCTGNTLAKLAHGITDTAVTMAIKSQLRADGRVLLALATNDALSGNLPNLGNVMLRKNIYVVPLLQDDPSHKPYSLVSRFEMIPDAVAALRRGEQLRPIFLS